MADRERKSRRHEREEMVEEEVVVVGREVVVVVLVLDLTGVRGFAVAVVGVMREAMGWVVVWRERERELCF